MKRWWSVEAGVGLIEFALVGSFVIVALLIVVFAVHGQLTPMLP